MKKNDKKMENTIVKALTSVCETLEDEVPGFSWLTHFVDYAQFPQSLKIVFVFDTRQSLDIAKSQGINQTVQTLTKTSLANEGVLVNSLDRMMVFDTEENGADFNSVGWCRRYS